MDEITVNVGHAPGSDVWVFPVDRGASAAASIGASRSTKEGVIQSLKDRLKTPFAPQSVAIFEGFLSSSQDPMSSGMLEAVLKQVGAATRQSSAAILPLCEGPHDALFPAQRWISGFEASWECIRPMPVSALMSAAKAHGLRAFHTLFMHGDTPLELLGLLWSNPHEGHNTTLLGWTNATLPLSALRELSERLSQELLAPLKAMGWMHPCDQLVLIAAGTEAQTPEVTRSMRFSLEAGWRLVIERLVREASQDLGFRQCLWVRGADTPSEWCEVARALVLWLEQLKKGGQAQMNEAQWHRQLWRVLMGTEVSTLELSSMDVFLGDVPLWRAGERQASPDWAKAYRAFWAGEATLMVDLHRGPYSYRVFL